MNPEYNALFPHGRIFQINTSDGGVPKKAVLEAQVTWTGLAGDRQRETNVHGGPERAVCLYSLEHIQALQAEGHPVFIGAMGENLTLEGLDWFQVHPGVRLQLGEAVELEITRFTIPCNNLKPYFLDGVYGRVSQSQHPGWSRVYGRVLKTGIIRVGDVARILADS